MLASLTPAGKTDWLRVFGGGMMDRGAGVAVGPDGAVGVTGNADMAICCGQPAKWGSVLVQQYTPAGKLQWQRKERRPGFNYGADVVYDDTRHLYVVGNSGGEPFDEGDSQLVLLKYQFDGPKHIRRYFGGPAQDHPAGIAVDDTSVYLLGTSNGLDGQPAHGETDIAVFRTPNGPLARHVRTHPDGTRTGVEAVDGVLDLVEANDRDGIVDAVDWELVPCDNHPDPGIILPPRCPAGSPDGTPVEVVKVACATWRYVRPGSLGAYIRLALNNDRGVFGVEKTTGGDNLGILPPNGHGILLAVRENLRPPGLGSYETAKDAPDADGFLIGIGEHGITGFWFGCGMSSASMLWKQAEWLLAPVGHQE